MGEVSPVEEFNHLGAGIRTAQRTALLSQLQGSAIAEQFTLSRQMLFPASHEFQAIRALPPGLDDLRHDFRQLTSTLGYWERAMNGSHTFASALKNNLATGACAQALHHSISSPLFASSWGGLALRDLAIDARVLAQRADRVCDALTMEFGPGAPKCVLPLMLATQTTMEASASLQLQAQRSLAGHELSAGRSDEIHGFIVHLEGTANRPPTLDRTLVRVNMALREHGGFGNLAAMPLVLDAGAGDVDLRLASNIVQQASQLRKGNPLSVRVRGSEAASRQLDNVASTALAGAPLPGEVRPAPAIQAAI